MNASAQVPGVGVRALFRPEAAQLASWGLIATALAVIQALVLAGWPAAVPPVAPGVLGARRGRDGLAGHPAAGGHGRHRRFCQLPRPGRGHLPQPAGDLPPARLVLAPGRGELRSRRGDRDTRGDLGLRAAARRGRRAAQAAGLARLCRADDRRVGPGVPHRRPVRPRRQRLDPVHAVEPDGADPGRGPAGGIRGGRAEVPAVRDRPADLPDGGLRHRDRVPAETTHIEKNCEPPP